MKPLTPQDPIESSSDKLFGDVSTDTFEDMPPHPSWDLTPPIDVPEPVIRFADMVNISSTIIALIFLLYAGAFIGYTIACLLR